MLRARPVRASRVRAWPRPETHLNRSPRANRPFFAITCAPRTCAPRTCVYGTYRARARNNHRPSTFPHLFHITHFFPPPPSSQGRCAHEPEAPGLRRDKRKLGVLHGGAYSLRRAFDLGSKLKKMKYKYAQRWLRRCWAPRRTGT